MTVTGFLVTAGAALSLAGNWPVLKGTWRGQHRPQVMSWLVWSSLLVIGGLATLKARQYPAAAYTLACAAGSLAVALLALRTPKAERRAPFVTLLGRKARLDLACLPAALAGLVLLVATRGTPAVAASLIADGFAFAPTYGHIWADPHGESWESYGLYAAGSALALAAVSWATFAGYAYPLYLLASDGSASALILLRRGRGLPARPGSPPGHPATGRPSGSPGAGRPGPAPAPR